MAVVITPVGGLGNQLFIYAAGKALARQKEVPLIVSTSHYRRYKDRVFELDSFESEWEDSSLYRTPAFSVAQKLVQLLWRTRRLVETQVRRGATPFDEALLFRPRHLRLAGHFWLAGYFQSWRYFDAVAEEMRVEISSIRKPSEFFRQTLENIRNVRVSVAVHVRRGDYTTNDYMGITPEEYYETSLRLMESLVGEFHIFLFSDDTRYLARTSFLSEWANRTTVVEPSEKSRPVETLNLIAMCDHVVMANSSFSWWGAWLGQRENRHVIYPRPWFARALVDDRDFALSSWICIGAG